MKLNINRLTLLDALINTGKVIGNNVIPALTSYLFSIDNDKIEIVGGSGDVYIKQVIEIINCGFTKAITIPKDKFVDLIKDSKDDVISFEIIDSYTYKGEDSELQSNAVRVITSNGEYYIPIENGNDFPKMKVEGEVEFYINPNLLIDGIKGTIFAASIDELKACMSGVYLFPKENSIIYTAVNGAILSTKTIQIDTNINLSKGLIIPQRALTYLLSSPIDKEENVKVIVSENNIQFLVTETLTIQSILVNERFVDYESVIPVSQPFNLFINRMKLIDALKRLIRFSEIGTSRINFVINEKSLVLNANNDFGNKASETLDCQFESLESFEIAFNGKTLQTLLSNINTTEVKFGLREPNKAALIREVSKDAIDLDKENLMLIMPLYILPKK